MAAKAVSRSALPPGDRFVVGGVSSLAVLGPILVSLVVGVSSLLGSSVSLSTPFVR